MPVNYIMHSRGLYSSNHVPKITSLLLQARVIVDGPSSLKGFDHHVKNDHNMWNYIYFSIYLDHIDTSDHNAIEGYVYEMVSTFKSCEDIINPILSSQIRQQKLEFFPLLAALALGEEQEDETASRLEKLETMVKDVLDRFKAEVRGRRWRGCSHET